MDVVTYLLLFFGRLSDVILLTKMEWTDSKEDILVDLWQQHPCLYDVGNKSYSNRNEKQKALTAISTHIKLVYAPLFKTLTRQGLGLCIGFESQDLGLVLSSVQLM